MAAPPNVYSVALFTIACVALGLLLLVVPQRDRKGALSLVGLLLAVLVWAGGYGMALMSATPSTELFWYNVRFVGPTFAPFFALVFAVQYAGREDLLDADRVWLLAAVPLVTNVLVWTSPYQPFLHAGAIVAAPAGDLVRLRFDWGPWYYVHLGYVVVAVCGALVLFVERSLRYGESHATVRRSQTMAVATALPLVGYFLYVAGVTDVDYGPLAFGLSGFLLFMADLLYAR